MKKMLFLPLATLLLFIKTGAAASSDIRKIEGRFSTSDVLQPKDRGLQLPTLLWQPNVGASPQNELQARQGVPPPPSPPSGNTPSGNKPPPQKQGKETPKERDLWRGEYFRKPEDVCEAGGFDSHGKRILERKHPDFPNGMNKNILHKGSSLYDHGTFKNPVSQYVPTSTSFEKAKNFAQKPDQRGFVYKIRSSSNMVDVSGSLGGDRHYKNFRELEVAGVYDIPWRQVEGWKEIALDPSTGNYNVGPLIQNKDFAPAKEENEEVTYTSHPELAGFPEGSFALSEEPWKQYKNEPVEGYLNNFLLTYRYGGDVDEFLKLRPDDLGLAQCAKIKRRSANSPVDGACGKLAAMQTSKTNIPGIDTKAPAEEKKANKGKGPGLLSAGQGYNTFLEKGLIPDAVILRDGKRRDLVPAPVAMNQSLEQFPAMRFNFTPPSANLTNLNITEYFAPIDVAAFMADILEDPSKEHNATVPNEIQARATDSESCPGTLRVYYKFIKDYSSYIRALEISGGATVSAWGQKASISGNYLDHAEISNNGLTYIAVMEIMKQPSLPTGDFNTQKYNAATFNRDFGDRWIQGFTTGGKMVARLTFNSKQAIKKDELKLHAETALKFWGSSGEISASAKKGMEEVDKHADMQISLFYQGDLGSFMRMPSTISAGSAAASLTQVKTWADQFLKDACKQNYEYQPFLAEYITAAGFPEREPPDYKIAHLISVKILQEIVRMSELTTFAKTNGWTDDETNEDLDWTMLEMVDLAQKWVDTVMKEPESAMESGKEILKTLQVNFFHRFSPKQLDVARIAFLGKGHTTM